jgi:hypothetical protein
MYENTETEHPIFLALALDGGELLASHFTFTTGKNSSTYCIQGWVGLRAILDVVKWVGSHSNYLYHRKNPCNP